jgi:hypothetical protein
VRIAEEHNSHNFRTVLRAPTNRVCQEKLLQLCQTVRAFVINRFALALKFILKGNQRQIETAIVGGVFSLSEQAVLLDTSFRNFLCVFV